MAGTQAWRREDVVIVGAARTPIGSFGGNLANVPATTLGSIAIKGALEKAKVDVSVVEACYMGNVYSAGLGQAPARQAALNAGLPESCTCTTVNKVCSSGLKSVTMAAQDIALGHADVVVAGGMENMSKVPYYLQQARFGYRIGDNNLVDGMMCDGLLDPYQEKPMGLFAESCARKYGFSREEQDAYAQESYRRSLKATAEGKFAAEIVPVVTTKARKEVVVTEDEECRRYNVEDLPTMRPSFVKDGSGTVTGGNASNINDGAAAVVLMSASKAAELGVEVLAKIAGYADAEQASEEFTTAPSLAIPKAVQRARISMEEIDVFEVNEAFSVVALANTKLLGLDVEKTNILGGAVSLGHPLGCSGTRILVTLLNVMKQRDSRRGVAGLCNGGGGSTAIVVERQSAAIW